MAVFRCVICGTPFPKATEYCSKCGARRSDRALPSALVWEMSQDDTYRKKCDTYVNLTLSIQDCYKYVNNANLWKSDEYSDAASLVGNCYTAANLAKDLQPFWRKYGDLGNGGRVMAFEYLAKSLEKMGKFREAAEACADAILHHFPFDGTKGGMISRMERMIKRGKFEPTQAMLNAQELAKDWNTYPGGKLVK